MQIIDYDKWQEILVSIGKHPLRTVLTAFGVAWGIFMLVMLLGFGEGLKNGVTAEFGGDAINSLWIDVGRTSVPYEGLSKGRRIILNNSDLDFVKDQTPEAAGISSFIYMGESRTMKYKNKARTFDLRGFGEDGAMIEVLEFRSGRSFNKRDIEDSRKVAIIGTEVQKELFEKGDDPVGKMLDIDGSIVKIVGVFYDPEEGRTIRRVYLPFATMQQMYSAGEVLDHIVVDMGESSMAEVTKKQSALDQQMRARKIIAPNDRRALDVYNRAEDYASFMSLIFSIKAISWLVGIFSMIAGVIGVSNIMLIIVKDRTKEIGIRKAIGATPASIINMIFLEAIIITGIAGYVGLGLGLCCLNLLKMVEIPFINNPEVNIWVASTATLILVLAGVLAGLLPAIKASRINPITAMRSE